MRLNYPGGCDHIASVRQFRLRFELADAPDGVHPTARDNTASGTWDAPLSRGPPYGAPLPSLRDWRTSKVVFLCHHLIVLVN